MDVRGKDGTSSSRPCACSGSPVKFPGVCVLTTSLFAVSYIPLTRPPPPPPSWASCPSRWNRLYWLQ